jgi:hypothetical protein
MRDADQDLIGISIAAIHGNHCKQVLAKLPMEFASEATYFKLLENNGNQQHHDLVPFAVSPSSHLH